MLVSFRITNIWSKCGNVKCVDESELQLSGGQHSARRGGTFQAVAPKSCYFTDGSILGSRLLLPTLLFHFFFFLSLFFCVWECVCVCVWECVCVCLHSPSLPGAGSGVWALVSLLALNPAGCGDQCLSVCVCVCMCVCVRACERGHVLLFFLFFLLLFLILRLGWLFYLSKNLERLWDFFFLLLHDFQPCSLSPSPSPSPSLFLCCSLTPSHPVSAVAPR